MQDPASVTRIVLSSGKIGQEAIAARDAAGAPVAIVRVAEFSDLGSDFYQRRIDRARRATHLLRQLHALGYQVQLTDAAA